MRALLAAVSPKHLGTDFDRYDDDENVVADIYEELSAGAGYFDASGILIHVDTEEMDWRAARESRGAKMAALIVAAVNELGGLLDALDAAERDHRLEFDRATRLGKDFAEANKRAEEWATKAVTLERENARLREALTEIAENPCLDPEGNADRARKAVMP